jgi:hypothetical protein
MKIKERMIWEDERGAELSARDKVDLASPVKNQRKAKGGLTN